MTSIISKFFFITALTFLNPILPLIYIVFVLTGTDLITGIWASLKEGNSIKSHVLGRSIIKILAYQVAILLAFGIETVYVTDSTVFTKGVAALIVMTEFCSNMENLAKITGNAVFLRVFDLFKTFLNTNKNILSSIDYKKDEKTGGADSETKQ